MFVIDMFLLDQQMINGIILMELWMINGIKHRIKINFTPKKNSDGKKKKRNNKRKKEY